MLILQGILTELREQSEQDAGNVIALRNNPDFNRFLSNPGQTSSIEDQLAWLRQEQAAGLNYNFSMFLGGKFSGTCSVYNITGYEADFGRYVATNPVAAIESEYLCLEFAFGQLGLQQVLCKTLTENEKVHRQHTRLGFETVGETVDDRVNKPLLVQALTAAAFERFDYTPVLSMLRKLKR